MNKDKIPKAITKVLDDSLMRIKNESKLSIKSEIEEQNNNQTDDEKELTIRAFDKLVKDGYAWCTIKENTPKHKTTTYGLTFDGLFFLENTPRKLKNRPYEKLKREGNNKIIAYKAKIALMAANAVIIIVLTVVSIYVNSSSNKNEVRMKVIESTIIKLSNQIETMKKNQ
jgi:hypothetical protein